MKQIQIPDFVRKVEDDDLAEFARAISDGDVNIYTAIRDENSKIVGERQVFLKSQIIDELAAISEQIKIKQEVLKKSKIGYKKELKKELAFLKKTYNVLLECPTYTPILDSEEITEYSEMVELDLAETLGSIKELTMKKTD